MFFSIFHVFCAGIVVLLLIPNLIYALRHRGGGISSGSRAVNLLEQIGRFGCMICMVVPLGVPGGAFGFCSPEAFLIWAAGIAALLLAYYACWVFYALRPGAGPGGFALRGVSAPRGFVAALAAGGVCGDLRRSARLHCGEVWGQGRGGA